METLRSICGIDIDQRMPTRAEVVAEARSWIGTPWHHQAHKKGVGCDCAGYLRGVFMELKLIPPESDWHTLNVKKYEGHARLGDGNLLLEASNRFLIRIPVSEIRIGDVVLSYVRQSKVPQHFGIVGDYRHGQGTLSMIHSCNDENRGTGKVKETRLSPHVLAKVIAAFQIPGIMD